MGIFSRSYVFREFRVTWPLQKESSWRTQRRINSSVVQFGVYLFASSLENIPIASGVMLEFWYPVIMLCDSNDIAWVSWSADVILKKCDRLSRNYCAVVITLRFREESVAFLIQFFKVVIESCVSSYLEDVKISLTSRDDVATTKAASF